ncbi:hypothetical protein IIO_03948 [Bacillus cereus VD115]|nr:hypothetical protein IIO_03948 [Bacillus cereus VD115]
MKKWIKITSILVIAIAVGIFTGYKVGTYAGSDEKQNERIKGEEVILDRNSDRHIINVMHKMTHQKGKARVYQNDSRKHRRSTSSD